MSYSPGRDVAPLLEPLPGGTAAVPDQHWCQPLIRWAVAAAPSAGQPLLADAKPGRYLVLGEEHVVLAVAGSDGTAIFEACLSR